MQILLVILIIFIIFEIPTCIGMGIIFKKTKLEFNKGIIPFYNKIILIKKYKLPLYHMILVFIPLAAIYTNYCIYEKLIKPYNKNIIYLLEITLFPCIFNILFGLEITEQQEEQIDNYFEDQKNLYEKGEETQETKKDEYIWYPKQRVKSNTIYRASRNNLNAKVNINIQKNNEIIDNKKIIDKKDKTNKKICPHCGTRVSETSEVCFVCGTKL